MNRLAKPSQKQLIVVGALMFSVGVVFSPTLQVLAQPPQSTFGDEAQGIGTPQPLATPGDDESSSSRSTRAIGTITGQGTVGSIAKFTGANAIGNSVLFENGGKVGIGTTTPSGLLSVKGTAANVYPIYGLGVGNAILGSSSGGVGVYGIHSNTSGDQSGLLGETASTSANAAGVVGSVKSTAPGASSAGVRGINLSRNANGFGVYGSQAGSGAGVYGTSAVGTGVYGVSSSGNALLGDSTNGTGVRGRHIGTTGTLPGVFGATNSTDANAVGVQGVVNSTSPGYQSAGVSGINNGTKYAGCGVYASHAGNGIGVYATSVGGFGVDAVTTSGVGVRGTSTSNEGVSGNSQTSKGVSGFSAKGDGVFGWSPEGIGVYGLSDSLAGYFQGNVVITGNLSKASGSFKIDHPQHPATEYLSHSFVESPDMMNVYNGNVTTNHKGEAVVTLPSYFQALNRDFRYQLTPIGAPASLYVAQKISHNHFKIAGGKAGMEVSWQVTGIRNDAYARQHRIKVEETKARADRGKYLYPAGFDAGQDRQIGAPAPRLAAR